MVQVSAVQYKIMPTSPEVDTTESNKGQFVYQLSVGNARRVIDFLED